MKKSYYDYEIKKITDKIENELKENKAALAAWQAVTFPTKKDGTPFKVMSKNISGARYRLEEYAVCPGEYELAVWGLRSEHTIWCYGHVEDMQKNNDERLAKTENYQPKVPYLKQVYCYDLDDIKAAVADEIERLKDRIAELENEMNLAESAFTSFFDTITEASRELAANVGKGTTLWYAMIDALKNNTYCLAD